MSKVLVLRTCNANLVSKNNFKWPESGPVECPDWRDDFSCGGGLHGWLWGEGDSSLRVDAPDAKGLVIEVEEEDIRHGQGDLVQKCKFRRGVVVFCGTPGEAGTYVINHGGSGKQVLFGTATAGYRGTATAGDRGTATAGDRGTATAGYRGTATAGDRGTATAGYSGTATAGDRGTATAGINGVICILRWNGKRYKAVIANVKDEDGDGELEPNTPYKLDENGKFVKAL